MTWQMQRMNYSHEALVDLILAHPTATHKELGDVFNRTAQWVTLVKSSDLFKEAYSKRAKEMMDPVLSATLEDRLQMLTSRSLEVLSEKLAKPSEDVPDNLALAAAALGAKAMALGGFSSRPALPPEAPKPDRINTLAQRLIALQTPEIIDASFREVPQAVPVGA